MGQQAKVSRFHRELGIVVEEFNRQYDESYEADRWALPRRARELDALYERSRHRFSVDWRRPAVVVRRP